MGAGQREAEGVIGGAPAGESAEGTSPDAEATANAEIVYALGAEAARTRARLTAAVAAAAMLAPIALVVVLLRRLGYGRGPESTTMAGIAAAIVVLVLVRAFVEARRLERRLVNLRVIGGVAEVRVEGESARLRVPRVAIARALEIEGSLGGLRLELSDLGGDSPTRIDIPRGGAAFGELRARVASWTPIERTRRRRAARLAIGVAVVAGIFFLPFVLEDFFGKSKPAALVLVLGLWIALRLLARR